MARIIFLLCIAIPIWARLNQDNDIQLWVTGATEKPLSPRTTLYLRNQWRFGDDVSLLFFTYLEGVLGVKWTDRIDIAPGYRQIWRLVAEKNWRFTYEPVLDLIFHHRTIFQFRNRISYLFHERAKNEWQYRARVRFSTECWTYNPYFSNEVFVLSHFGFTQNRTMVGVTFPLFSKMNTDLSYMLRFIKLDGLWTYQHVFGTWFNFTF